MFVFSIGVKWFLFCKDLFHVILRKMAASVSELQSCFRMSLSVLFFGALALRGFIGACWTSGGPVWRIWLALDIGFPGFVY